MRSYETMSSYYRGYVKFINVESDNGMMKFGMSSQIEPAQEQPELWLNLSDGEVGAYSDIAKQMILNMRYAYIYGCLISVLVESSDGGYSLREANVCWKNEIL